MNFDSDHDTIMTDVKPLVQENRFDRITRLLTGKKFTTNYQVKTGDPVNILDHNDILKINDNNEVRILGLKK